MRASLLFTLLFLSAAQIAFSQPPELDSAAYDPSTRTLFLYGSNFETGDSIITPAITFSNGTDNYNLNTSADYFFPTDDETADSLLSGLDLAHLNGLFDETGISSTLGNFELWVDTLWNGTDASPDTAQLRILNLVQPTVDSVRYDYDLGILSFYAGNLATDGIGDDNDIDVSTIEITGKEGDNLTLSNVTGDTDIDSDSTFSITVSGNDKDILDSLFNRNGTQDADNNNYTITFNANWNPVHGNSNVSSTGVTLEVINGNFPPVATNVTVSGNLNVDEQLTGSYDFTDFEGDNEGASQYLWYRADDGSGTDSTLISGANDTLYTLTTADSGNYIRFAVIPESDQGPSPGDTVFSDWEGPVQEAFPRFDDATYDATTQQLTLNGYFRTGDDITVDAITFAVVGDASYTLSSTAAVTPTSSAQAEIVLSGLDIARLNHLLDNVGTASNDSEPYEIHLADNWNGTTASPDTGGLNVTALSSPTVLDVEYDAGSWLLQMSAANLATDGIGDNDDIDVSTIEITGKNGQTHTLSSTQTNNTDIIGVDTFTIAVGGDDQAILDTLFNRNGTFDADSNDYSISFNTNWNAVHGNQVAVLDVELTVTNGNFPPVATNVTVSGNLNVDEQLTGSYDFTDFEDDNEGASQYLWYRADDANGTNSTFISGANDTLYTLATADSGNYIRFAVIPESDQGPSPGDTVFSDWQGPVQEAFPRFDGATYDATTQQLTLNGYFRTGDDITVGAITFAVVGDTSYTLSSTAAVTPTSSAQAEIVLSGLDIARLNHLLDNTGTSGSLGDYEIQLADNWNGTTASPDTGELNVTALSTPTILNAEYDAGSWLLQVSAANLATNGTGDNDDIDVTNIRFTGKSNISYTLSNTSNVDIIAVDSFTVTITGQDSLALDTLFNANGTQDSTGIDYNIIVEAGWNPVHSTSPQDTSTSLDVSNVNFPPFADNVIIDGEFIGEETLEGDYNFVDDAGDTEQGTLYLWYRADDNNGTNAERISGANEQSYDLTPDDEAKYIRFAVIPHSDAGLNPGDTAYSTWNGAVDNAAPRAENVTILYDTLVVGDTLRASYDYEDFEDDEEGATEFRWLRADDNGGANNEEIEGAEDSTYVLTDDDLGKYIRLYVEPVQQKENKSGTERNSNYEGLVQGSPPSATISGIDSICPGATSDSIEIELTGEPNWTVIYAIDSVPEDTITGIASSPYVLSTDQEGEYTVVNVSNDLYSDGTESGTGEIIFREVPTATLSGDTSICNTGSSQASLSLTFTGSSPWNFSYSINGDTLHVNNIDTANYTLAVSDTGLYEMVTVSDAYCEGSVSGNAQVDYHVIPTAQITGSTSICVYDSALVTVNLDGNQPFDFSYYLEGSENDTTEISTQSSEHTFYTSTEGTYRLHAINDTYCPGELLSDSAVTIDKYPEASAVMSGNDSICDDGSTAPINLSFQGTAPYAITYTVDGADTTTRSDINSQLYSFQVDEPGLYEIIAMNDANCSGQVSGQATIGSIPTPTAEISGDELICQGDTTQLMIALTGVSPWNLTYTINGTNPQAINNIQADTIFIDAHQEGNYAITELSDSLCGGGIKSGLATVGYRTTPSAQIFDGETICAGDTSDEITVAFNGTSPYSFAYSINDSTYDTINNINNTSYHIEAYLEGTYTIDWMTDQYCTGNTSGSGEIIVNELPEVEITGLQEVYSSTSSDVLLTGTPTGGNFSGTGIIMDQGDAYFSPAEAFEIDQTHYIQYEYTDPSTTCTNTDVDTVFVIGADGEIIIQKEKDVYCFNDEPFLVNGVNIAQDTGSFEITGDEGLTDHGNNTATVDPGILEDGIYTITYTYFDDDTFRITKDIEVEYVDSIWIITNLPEEVCENGPAISLVGNHSGALFSGAGVFGSQSSGFEFQPDEVDADSSDIHYSLTTVNGCARNVHETVLVNPIANIDFELENICVDIENQDTARFVNNTTSTDSVVTWNWNFDDVNSGAANTSDAYSPAHYYNASGVRNVALSATTDKNCTTTRTKEIIVSDVPVAGFYSENNCYRSGQPVHFVNTSSSDNTITDHQWQIEDSVLSGTNIDYLFDQVDAYNVQLTIANEYGCVDTSEKEIILKPVVSLSDNSYEQYFEGDDLSGWNSGSEDQVNSWVKGIPDGETIEDTNQAWYTSINGSPGTEYSWVSSPCFNFEETVRPMVKLNVWKDFEDNGDGANLQYTTDNGRTWSNVGGVNDGIEWYNDNNINANPGGSSVGWSGNDGGNDDGWVNARNNLDHLTGEEFVQFRIAYGASGRQGNTDGFAFDDFWLGERSRVVLLEHFTSSADSDSKNADDIVDNISTQYPHDVIDIQYHTQLSGTDPLNQDNPVDVSDRVFYYSIPGVPFSYMNGTDSYDYASDSWNEDDLIIESLRDEGFEISMTATKNNNIVSGDVTMKAKQEFPGADITLYIVIVETIIDEVEGQNGDTEFRQVVKSMEPNSAGTNFLKSWNIGDSNTVGYTYQINDAVYNAANLSVVAFVQDENSGEIYQASSVKPQNVTDIGDHRMDGEGISFSVYPNPVNDYAIVSFNHEIRSEVTIQIMDASGVVQNMVKLFPGSEIYKIDVTDREPGYYLIRVISGGKSGIKPVMISKTR